MLTNKTLFEVEQGAGEPLILIHGSTSDYRTWQVSQKELSKSFRTISYSRCYHWPNPKIAESADYSMGEHVDDLKGILQTREFAPAHVVGHSYGGFVALLLALHKPDLVRTLVLIEPPVLTLFLSNPPKPFELLRLALRKPTTAAAILRFGLCSISPATAAARRGDEEKALQVFGSGVLGAEGFRRLSKSRLDQARTNFISAEFLGSGFPALRAAELRTLQTPTLLIGGERSPKLFSLLLDALEEMLPRAERVQIPRASHIVHEDNPAAFNEALIAFLAKQRIE